MPNLLILFKDNLPHSKHAEEKGGRDPGLSTSR